MIHISQAPEAFEIITFRLPFFYQEAEDAINLFLFHRAYKPAVESWMFYSKYLRENTQHKKRFSINLWSVLFCFFHSSYDDITVCLLFEL